MMFTNVYQPSGSSGEYTTTATWGMIEALEKSEIELGVIHGGH